jgi:hypothetical protein
MPIRFRSRESRRSASACVTGASGELPVRMLRGRTAIHVRRDDAPRCEIKRRPRRCDRPSRFTIVVSAMDAARRRSTRSGDQPAPWPAFGPKAPASTTVGGAPGRSLGRRLVLINCSRQGRGGRLPGRCTVWRQVQPLRGVEWARSEARSPRLAPPSDAARSPGPAS